MDGTDVPERHPRLKGLMHIAWGIGVWAGIVLLGILVLALAGGPDATGWTGFVVDLVTGLLAEVAGVVGGMLVLAGLVEVVTGTRSARKAEEADMEEFMARLTQGGRAPNPPAER